MVMGLSELQKWTGGSGVRGPIIGLAKNSAGVFNVGNCVGSSFGLITGIGDATDNVVVTTGVTFNVSGFGFGLDEDVLLGDLGDFCDKLSAMTGSPEVVVRTTPALELEALTIVKLVFTRLSSEGFVNFEKPLLLPLSSTSFLIKFIPVACCADDFILAAL